MWLCGAVETGQEHKVKSWAIERGHDVYYPLSATTQRKRGNRKRVTVTRAAWPGYVFLNAETDLNELHRAPGFLEFIKFGPCMAMLSDDQIEAIRIDEQDGRYDAAEASRPQLVLGETMTIQDGPMAGLRGIVTTIKADRVKLSRGDLRMGAVWVNMAAVA